jgi:hypothetical protein
VITLKMKTRMRLQLWLLSPECSNGWTVSYNTKIVLQFRMRISPALSVMAACCCNATI